ncbi:hypothetical protein IMCC1989_2794 [gamma proteobacterium IMCC1989]|nr:hypothetical protein IMCC1989_2794 [gamma proteobacterium IMCC1989]
MCELKEEFKTLIIELLEVPEEGRERKIIERLDKIAPDPEYMNYIYSCEEFETEGGFDIDGYTKKVFSYKPILL